MYGDDPSLSSAKIVYSIYDDSFSSSLSKALPDKMKQDRMTDRDLSLLKNSTDFLALTNLAIHYSDGVIQGSPQINKTTADFIEKENKLFLPYHSEESYIDAYNEFYDKVLTTKSRR
jgi:starch synthase